MKGILFKKILPEGWYIAYDVDSFTKSEIRLHKYDAIRMIDKYHNGKQVDFEIIRWCKTHKSSPDKNSVCTVDCGYEEEVYARLVPYVSDDFQIGPDGAYEHEQEVEGDWDVTLMDGLEDDDTIPPTEELIESHKRYVEMMKYIHEEEWERIYSKYKGVSDLNDFFDWLKTNYYPPAKKQIK